MTGVEVAALIAQLTSAAAQLAAKLADGKPVTQAEIEATLAVFQKARAEQDAESKTILGL